MSGTPCIGSRPSHQGWLVTCCNSGRSPGSSCPPLSNRFEHGGPGVRRSSAQVGGAGRLDPKEPQQGEISARRRWPLCSRRCAQPGSHSWLEPTSKNFPGREDVPGRFATPDTTSPPMTRPTPVGELGRPKTTAGRFSGAGRPSTTRGNVRLAKGSRERRQELSRREPRPGRGTHRAHLASARSVVGEV